nr:exocyst complex component EXO84C-like [Arachis hypogaea]
MSENKVDEALELLESADAHYQGIQFEDYSDSDINLYNSVISEKMSMLKQRLIQIAKNDRMAGPELQKVLSGLCRLGETQLAIELLLKYYHSRIMDGTKDLQWSKSSSNEAYIRELARFVFSIISQAAKSFVMLCGESSPYASELMMWSCEETKSFVAWFDEYVKKISATNGSLSYAIKAVKFAVLYCSLLEDQSLVLQPYLVMLLCPCIEEVLNTHVNHFKKVVGIFSVSDSWGLEKYLVSGVFGGGSLNLDVEEQPEYCVLTTSGRKFLTLLQAIVEDISPLVALQMGNSIIGALSNLITEYVTILERALTYDTRGGDHQVSPRIKLAESVAQQVSILANMSTLTKLLFVMVKGIYSSNDGGKDSNEMEENLDFDQRQELEEFMLFLEESSHKLRTVFCQQLIAQVSATYHSHEIFSAIQNVDQFDDNRIQYTMPSGIFQVLFLELRKIERLDEENMFEVNWLIGLLRELMESMFIWISNNKDIYATQETNQFVMDVQFLVEIGMHGGYFSNDPLLLLTLMKSTFNSAGLDPFKDADNDGWAIDAATKTIQKLLEIEKTTMQPKESVVNNEEGELHESQSNQSAYLSEEGDLSSSENNNNNNIDALDEEDEVEKDDLEVAIDTNTLREHSVSTMQSAPTIAIDEKGQNSEEIKSK